VHIFLDTAFTRFRDGERLSMGRLGDAGRHHPRVDARAPCARWRASLRLQGLQGAA